jgi:hypothetical protein
MSTQRTVEQIVAEMRRVTVKAYEAYGWRVSPETILDWADALDAAHRGEAVDLRPSADEIRAEAIARMAHAGQKDTVTGADYIEHVERVVALVDDPDAKVVAWLHDVLEDSLEFTVFHLLNAGIPQRIVDAVLLLTRQPPYDYASYIDAIKESGDVLAIAVKRADLIDHLRPNCPERLRPRYERAIETLGGLDAALERTGAES